MEQEQKQIKVGDRVRVKCLTIAEARAVPDNPYYNSEMQAYNGQEFVVNEVQSNGNIKFKENPWEWHPAWLELIEEPESILDRVRGCIGAKIYSRVHGYVTIERILEGDNEPYPIEAKTSDGSDVSFTADGYENIDNRGAGGEPILLPAKDETDWSKWDRADSWRPAPGEKYFFLDLFSGIRAAQNDGMLIDNSYINTGNRFRTKEAAEKALEEIRKILKTAPRE